MGSAEDVRKTLSQLSFAPSCVDMGWEWEVEVVYRMDAENPLPGRPQMVGCSYRLRTTFMRPDRETREIKKGFGRWWEVPLDVTVSGVVKTAFAAAKMILEHELMESFKWRDARVFDPHHTVGELASIQPGRYTDSIL